MKALVLNHLRFAIATVALALFSVGAWAQTGSQLTEKSLPVGEFTSVNVSGDFDVTITNAATYSAKVTTNNQIAEYVEVYVRSKVLYISYNEKAVPKDVKKALKAKDAPELVFRAVVYTPELNGVTLSDNAVLTGTDEFFASDFSLTMEDKSQLKNLSISAKTASVSLKDKTEATIILKAEKGITLKTDGNAVLRATTSGSDLSVTAGGSSNLTSSVDSKKVSLDGNGRAEVMLNGMANSLQAKCDRSVKVNARSLTVKEVEANMKGGELRVSPEKTLDVELTGGSELYFNGKPEMKVRRIVKSSLMQDDNK